MKIIGGWGSARAPEGQPWVLRSGRRARAAGSVIAAAIAMALGGCASAPKPTQVTGGSIEGSAQLNPSVTKRPSPLVVRIYELKSATAFNSADFVALFERDKAELAADIVSRDEIVLQPGEARPIAAKTLSPDVKFIAVMGAFRDLERARWRSVASVVPNQKQSITVRADANTVTVTVAAAK